MLQVKSYIAPSKIEGIGLFAGEEIKKGTITWKYTPGFDLEYSQDELDSMAPSLRDYIKTYASLSMISNLYILGSDNVKFTNHSSDPNLEAVIVSGQREKVAIAKRDIKKGEEMTIDYRTFDQADAVSPQSYLQ